MYVKFEVRLSISFTRKFMLKKKWHSKGGDRPFSNYRRLKTSTNTFTSLRVPGFPNRRTLGHMVIVLAHFSKGKGTESEVSFLHYSPFDTERKSSKRTDGGVCWIGRVSALSRCAYSTVPNSPYINPNVFSIHIQFVLHRIYFID